MRYTLILVQLRFRTLSKNLSAKFGKSRARYLKEGALINTETETREMKMTIKMMMKCPELSVLSPHWIHVPHHTS